MQSRDGVWLARGLLGAGLMLDPLPSADEMHRRLLRDRPELEPSWYPEEVRRGEWTRRALRALTALDTVDSFFQALRPCLPFAAGLVEVFQASRPTEVVDRVFQVPEAFLTTRSRHLTEDPLLPLLGRLPVGWVCRDEDALPEDVFRSLRGSQALYPHFGLDRITGMSLAVTPRGVDREHVVLWLLQEREARAPTWRECRLLERAHAEAWAALARMRLPYLPQEPLHFQLLQERGVGALLLRPGSWEVVELNQRALQLAFAYQGTRPAQPWRSLLRDFLQRFLSATPQPGHSVRYLRGEGGLSGLEVSTHHLAREHYLLSEDVLLVELREVLLASPPRVSPRLGALPPRQREVALLLAETGLSYKQIAGQLGLSEGTVRKHTERVYRGLGIHSRPELVSLLRAACFT